MDKQSVKQLAWLRQDVQVTEAREAEAYEHPKAGQRVDSSPFDQILGRASLIG